MMKPNENLYWEFKKNSLALNLLEFRLLYKNLIERARLPAIYNNQSFLIPKFG